MHISLLEEIDRVKTRAEELGLDVDISPTLDDNSVIFYNSTARKVVIMGRIEFSGQEVLAAYSVDPYKWEWAEKEGFTKEEIMSKSKLSSQVFREILIDKVADSLV